MKVGGGGGLCKTFLIYNTLHLEYGIKGRNTIWEQFDFNFTF